MYIYYSLWIKMIYLAPSHPIMPDDVMGTGFNDFVDSDLTMTCGKAAATS